MRKIYTWGLFAVLLAASAAVSSCAKDEGPVTPPKEMGLNEWMFEYMKTHYLWNDAVKKLTPDYTLDYEEFLNSVLNGVAAQGDVNHDDGHWEDGRRSYFYSNIQRFKTTRATRGTRETEDGTGIRFMNVLRIEENKPPCFFHLLAVAPGSPAAKAGLKRGAKIFKVDGVGITDNNYNTYVDRLTPEEAGKTVRVTTAEFDDQGRIIENPEIKLVSASYDDNPVWVSKTFDAANGDKVGYLCYAAFNYNYDQQLMNAFKAFKTAGVKEVILDLRYNGGGHVISSLMMGTMIVGESKKNQVYSKNTYNASRTAAGETSDQYKIGDGTGLRYAMLTSAVGSTYALGLNKVYVLCTGNTASSSELVVNGLRGLDIGVRLIGERTNGKNVGMEPVTKTTGGYEYQFSPITFYSVNAKGFNDYSNGFDPDVTVDEEKYASYEWGDGNDPLVRTAMKWINDGTKPTAVPGVTPSKTSRGAESVRREVLKTIRGERGLSGMILLPVEE